MKILIVGAGAVGKVYGRHFALGGAKVSFFVKEKYRESAEAGFRFYELNQSAKQQESVWTDYSVLTSLSEIQKTKWNYVLLAMSSTGLKAGFLDSFLPAIHESPIVSLQPGLLDRDYLLERVPESRLIMGTIPIISFEAPLPGSKTTAPGTAYWLPPGAFGAFSGNPHFVDPLVRRLKRGRFSVKKVPDTSKLNLIAAPLLGVFVQALENSDWSFENLKSGPWLEIASRALPEAVAIQAHKAGVKAPFLSRLVKPFLFRGLMNLSPSLVPFNLETYLRVHFLKVQDQMHENLKLMIQYGEAKGLANEALRQLFPTKP